MSYTTTIAVMLVVASIYISDVQGQAGQCYKCTYRIEGDRVIGDRMCREGGDDKFVRTCESDENYFCEKLIFDVEGYYWVSRDCKSCREGEHDVSTKNGTIHGKTYCCSSPLCNQGLRVPVSLAVMLLMAVTASWVNVNKLSTPGSHCLLG